MRTLLWALGGLLALGGACWALVSAYRRRQRDRQLGSIVEGIARQNAERAREQEAEAVAKAAAACREQIKAADDAARKEAAHAAAAGDLAGYLDARNRRR